MPVVFRTFFLSLLLALMFGGQMSATPTGEDGSSSPVDNLLPMDSVEIGLVTCAPHDEVYSLYGHTALRWHDLRTGTDMVFNYGIFRFEAPHFVTRFVFGLTDYELGVAPTSPFLRYYAKWGSEVTEQVLNLTPVEKLRLTAALHENAQPENRVYRYNFFFDNCATRPRDMVERNIDGKVRYMPRADYDVSFRDMVRQQTRNYPWGTFGNDILLGLRADMKTTQREQEFLPDNLRYDFDRATIVATDGSRPLVLERRQLVPPGVQMEEEGFPLRPMACALLLLAVSLIVFVYEQFKHAVLRWFDVFLMLLTGLAGCVLFVMVFSEHPATSANLQLLLLNPLPLFFIWRVARGRHTRWFAIQAVLLVLFCIGGLWQSYAEGMYVVAACVLTRCWRHITVNRSMSFVLLCFMPVVGHASERADDAAVVGYASERADDAAVVGYASERADDATLGSVAHYTPSDGVPRLVVSIAVDQLRSDYLEAFAPYYGNGGFRRLLSQGVVYSSASYPFTPVDRASAVATLATGATPYYHSIVGQRWLNRETLRPVRCTDDETCKGVQTFQTASPAMLAASTIADEMRIATDGRALVWSVAPFCDAAVMAGGHAANGVLWIDDETGYWCSSQYYGTSLPSWVHNVSGMPAMKAVGKDAQRFRQYKASAGVNADITMMAVRCLDYEALGRDDVPDLLCITYNAGSDGSREQLIEVYRALDAEILRLLDTIGQRIGLENVLFVLTGTGYCEEHEETDYASFRIPTGTFYMSRTADLLNMYLGAIWGQGKYVDTTFRNHIFLNHALLDKKTISIGEATRRAQELLVMMAGVRNVYTSLQLLTLGNDQIERVRNGYCPERCGDLVVQVAPGWRVMTENTGESEYERASFVQSPIIFFRSGMEPRRIQTHVTTDRIAPTIARAVRTRAPNACSAEPLF